MHVVENREEDRDQVLTGHPCDDGSGFAGQSVQDVNVHHGQVAPQRPLAAKVLNDGVDGIVKAVETPAPVLTDRSATWTVMDKKVTDAFQAVAEHDRLVGCLEQLPTELEGHEALHVRPHHVVFVDLIEAVQVGGIHGGEPVGVDRKVLELAERLLGRRGIRVGREGRDRWSRSGCPNWRTGTGLLG